jgi:hypothetical protein
MTQHKNFNVPNRLLCYPGLVVRYSGVMSIFAKEIYFISDLKFCCISLEEKKAFYEFVLKRSQ